jgi:predicted NAD-dependent protein-ADP-ribosyltransferase YbiA (DUF1768 family)
LAKDILTFDDSASARSFLLPRYRYKVEFCDREYRSIEHAMLGAYSMDPADQRAIADAKNMERARYWHAQIVEKRPFWSKCRAGIMMGLTEQKFLDPWLQRRLLATHPAILVYKSDDTFWGVNRKGEGDNRLGQILMIVRDNFRLGRGTPYLKFRKWSRNKVKTWRAKRRQLMWAGLPHTPPYKAALARRARLKEEKKRAKAAKRLNRG